MPLTRAFVQQEQLDEAINAVRPLLGPDVVSLQYALGDDWSGDPSIFFRIVLSERASQRDQMFRSTNELETTLVQHIQPYERWGVLHYFSYRSPSEHARLKDAQWP